MTDEAASSTLASRAAHAHRATHVRDQDASRLRPPPLPDQLVRRDRLVHLLDAAVRRRVTVVVAPTGYGKTTLVAQWAATRHSRRVAWLTVTSADNEPGRFEQLVRTALQNAGRHGDADADDDPVRPRGDPSVVLVLDDVQEITNTRLFDRLASDLDALPSLRLILLSRSDPLFPSYRFRLRDQVAEVRQRELAFDRWEAKELLAAVARKPLSDEHVVTLLDRTEGWPAALHLAAASIRSAADPGAFIGSFGADARHVADYLTDHMLRMQPADVQHFLLATSVLHQVNGSLCDYLLDATDSDAMLGRLERAAIMISPVDDRRTWFRYHRLLRLMMRQQLRAHDPTAERMLLERAADWHLAHDNVHEAIGYFAEAGAWDKATDAVFRAGPSTLATGGFAELLEWIELLPREQVVSHPTLLLLEASGRLASRQALEARRVLKTIAAIDTLSPANAMAADVLFAAWQLQHGAPEPAIAAAELAIERAAALGPPLPGDLVQVIGGPQPLIGAAHVVRAMALLQMGNFTASSEALAPVLTNHLPILEARALGIAALNDALSGRMRAAARTAARAVELARERGLGDGPTPGPALLAQAIVARARDDSEETGRLLGQAMERLDPGSFLAALVRIEQSKLALSVGDSDEAYALIAFSRG